MMALGNIVVSLTFTEYQLATFIEAAIIESGYEESEFSL